MKRVTLFLKPFCYKFIRSQMQNGVLVLRNRMVSQHTNGSCKQSSTDTVGFVAITLETRITNARYLYAVRKELERQFYHEMHLWIAAHKMSGRSALKSAQDFLAVYDISADEYSIDAAYRSWTRHKYQYLQPYQSAMIERLNIVR